jgi:hypothetical protein
MTTDTPKLLALCDRIIADREEYDHSFDLGCATGEGACYTHMTPIEAERMVLPSATPANTQEGK